MLRSAVCYSEPFSILPRRKINQLEGNISRWIKHETRGDWDFCDFPLKSEDDDAFNRFRYLNLITSIMQKPCGIKKLHNEGMCLHGRYILPRCNKLKIYLVRTPPDSKSDDPSI